MFITLPALREFVGSLRIRVSLACMGMPSPIEYASLGLWDSLILLLIALVVFGPRRLPEIGRQLGRLLFEIRKISSDFNLLMEEELSKAEEAKRQREPATPAQLLAGAGAASDKSSAATGTGKTASVTEQAHHG
jgi:sec-independent protein translocase protein TatB